MLATAPSEEPFRAPPPRRTRLSAEQEFYDAMDEYVEEHRRAGSCREMSRTVRMRFLTAWERLKNEGAR